MPEKSGSEIAYELKNNPNHHHIPIIFLTANVLKEEVQDHGGLIGGYPFLAKPAPLPEIIECIENNLK